MFYVLATSKVISGQVKTSDCTHGDFIVLPHWDTSTMYFFNSLVIKYIWCRSEISPMATSFFIYVLTTSKVTYKRESNHPAVLNFAQR